MKVRAIYTISQLAELADVAPRTARHWVESGRIKPIRVGESIFVTLNAFRDAMPEIWQSICTKRSVQAGECEACGAPIRAP